MMYTQTKGTVISIQKQYQVTLVDYKPANKYDLFTTIHPYLIKIKYRVGNKIYIKKKVSPTKPNLHVGTNVVVKYNKRKPSNCVVFC